MESLGGLSVRNFVFGVGAITIAVAFYLVAQQSGLQLTLPRYEDVRPGDLFDGLNQHVAITLHSGEFQTLGHQWWDETGTRFLPCRYPQKSGQNVTAVIHHGWTQLSRPAPADNDWIMRPPGEVQF